MVSPSSLFEFGSPLATETGISLAIDSIVPEKFTYHPEIVHFKNKMLSKVCVQPVSWEDILLEFKELCSSRLKLPSLYQSVCHKIEVNTNAYHGPNGFESSLFWPDPTSSRDGRSKYSLLPIARKVQVLNKSDIIASMGSCFAEEVSKRLGAKGYNYKIYEQSPFATTKTKFSANWGIVFNPLSIKQNIQWYFDLIERPSICWSSTHSGKNMYYDPFREDVLYENLAAHAQDISLHRAAGKRALSECHTFVVTLGMTEYWKLNRTGLAVARSPWKICPLAGEFASLSVGEVIECLNTAFNILKANNNKIQIILTVSPVALHASFRKGHHVIESNQLSKSILRVAAEEVSKTNQFVHYFPSYEIVHNCARNPWKENERHVSEESIEKVFAALEIMHT